MRTTYCICVPSICLLSPSSYLCLPDQCIIKMPRCLHGNFYQAKIFFCKLCFSSWETFLYSQAPLEAFWSLPTLCNEEAPTLPQVSEMLCRCVSTAIYLRLTSLAKKQDGLTHVKHQTKVSPVLLLSQVSLYAAASCCISSSLPEFGGNWVRPVLPV